MLTSSACQASQCSLARALVAMPSCRTLAICASNSVHALLKLANGFERSAFLFADALTFSRAAIVRERFSRKVRISVFNWLRLTITVGFSSVAAPACWVHARTVAVNRQLIANFIPRVIAVPVLI